MQLERETGTSHEGLLGDFLGSMQCIRLWMYHLEATISAADITAVPSESSQELVLTAKSLRTTGGEDAP